MPIKFRCEYCQQLLGISRSRAAATVDCPQCGRSLKVPGSTGKSSAKDVQASKTHDSSAHDIDLMSALNELTMLGQGDETDQGHNASSPAIPRPFDDSSMIMEGKDVPEERARHRDSGDRDRNPKTVSTPRAGKPPADTNEALQDLASWAADESVIEPSPSAPAKISTDLLTEMRQASYPASWLATSIAAVLLIAISGAAGWWLARSGTLDSWLAENLVGNGAADGTDDGNGDRQDNEPVHIPAAIMVDPDQWVISVVGQARYVDESGQELNDGNASIYLLPSTREGNLKVHARSFQRDPSNADRRFSEAALQALGGMRVEADEEGRFEIGTAAKSDLYQLIVVSRNRERPENVLADSSITNALLPYFDSTVHVLGQRSATMKTVADSDPDMMITVGK